MENPLEIAACRRFRRGRKYGWVLGLGAVFALGFVWVTTAGISPAESKWNLVALGVESGAARNPLAGGALSLSSQGRGLEGEWDGGAFCYQTVLETGAVTGRLSDPHGLGGSASRAGLMLRGNLRADAAQIFVGVGGDGKGYLGWRSEDGGVASIRETGMILPTDWLRLAREGGTVFAYRSSDGVVWDPIAGVDLGLDAAAFVGAVASSGDEQVAETAAFAELELNRAFGHVRRTTTVDPGTSA
ncbi:MAG: hypothetical protein WD342_17920, partial [Verrucomicrobiales bacterium]